MKTRLIQELKRLIRAWLLRSTRNRPEVYLTFDDGPHPVGTPALLDVLRRHEVPATFFLIGTAAERFPDAVDAIVADEHLIGNHSLTHRHFGQLGSLGQWRQMRAAERILRRHDRLRGRPFRAPQGRFRPLFGLWLALRGRGPIHWSLDSGDGGFTDVDELVEHLREHPPGPGDVLLFHDDSPVTPRALERLLPEWKAAGLTFARLPGWEVGR
ncbi:Peptidoglycan/xylan/chitin deacetylase, PgdA/CDA1 family [Thiohalospira halophila DSM 15071]|uniref:Peptidoglycan/xylan/chitin deacetylase, PgdA/CDA1 family n=1 Tax=Thiohalospira halophila DSM 15071 TaxID=1123397 RepID=A0A1I1NU99_9GAMM|nr:polysaccharide deacetylase family protein [Thiohalospira halophila]SFC98313.1 Peptidoglycan/xylan/chitin deacetylase, PgdA/CDA1 family [Thiohalospira halophila DSM 15071]